VKAGSQPFYLVLDPELLFFERGDPVFIPIGAGHLGVYAVFEFSVLIGQMIDMPLQCHARTSSFQAVNLSTKTGLCHLLNLALSPLAYDM
jgi:hypothetical protein